MPLNHYHYTQSPLQDSRLLGPRPWKILAATYETHGFLSNPDPGENLVMENLVMETGCIIIMMTARIISTKTRDDHPKYCPNP